MISRFLDEQNIRRRRSRGRPVSRRKHDRVLDRQDRPRLTAQVRRRVGTVIRIGALGLVIAGLATGLVIIGNDSGAAEALATTVVSDDLERSAMTFTGPMVGDLSGLGEVAFERTEDSEYIVAEGETLSEIANRFDLSYEQLATYNELADPDTLSPGQRILVPSIDAIVDLSG